MKTIILLTYIKSIKYVAINFLPVLTKILMLFQRHELYCYLYWQHIGEENIRINCITCINHIIV